MIATFALTLALSAPAFSPAASAPTCCAGHQDPVEPPVAVTVQPLGAGCFRLHHSGANIGVYLGPDGILMVDTGFLESAPEIERAITELWDAWWSEHEARLRQDAEAAGTEAVVPPKPAVLPIRYVVSTHFHEDHVGANAYFGLAGAQVIAHESVRRRLRADPAITDTKVLDPPMDFEGVPAITFEDALTLHFNGGPIEIRHYPLAHTDGDCVVNVPKANVLFAGDVYYNSAHFPYLELLVGARPRYLIAALEDILADLPTETRVMPGHGVAGDAKTLREFADMFTDCDRQMRREVAAGKNTMELYNLKMYGEYEDQWAGGVTGRVRNFMAILWFCYAPKTLRGLGELDKERAEAEGASGGEAPPAHDHDH